MIKFRIEQQNGRVFLLKAILMNKLHPQYNLWYKRKGLWRRWHFVCTVEDQNYIEQIIYFHFGFTSVVRRIS